MAAEPNKQVPQLSSDEIIALNVLMKTDYVRNWAIGELTAYGLNIHSPKSRRFIYDKSIHISLIILGKKESQLPADFPTFTR